MVASKFQIPLKIVLHKQEERVLFAEANSEFVDILFTFLTMPMATIVKLLSNHSYSSQPPVITSFNNLYRSIADLEAKYFATEACKDMLLNMRNSGENVCQKLKVNVNCSEFLNEYAFFNCTTVGDEGVFVHPKESFIITNDLHVIPNIPALALAIQEKSGPTDFGVLEEKTFQIGYSEILDLLKYSILSKSPLTSMFLTKKDIDKDNLVRTNYSQMSTEAISFKKMTVKVLVRKTTNKILLANCSEDFIEFLFGLLTIPLGRVTSLVKNYAPCVENVLQSVSNLNVGKNFKSQLKDTLLHPRLATPVGEGGFLKVSTKFMVTDDLVVTPFTTMSFNNYIQSCDIPRSDIEEQVMDIDMKEALNLLTSSLVSTSVLTNGLNHLIRSKPKTERLVKKPRVEK